MALEAHPIEPGRRALAAYAPHAGEEAPAALRERAAALRGLRVVHVTAPPFAPAAADMLGALVPLLNDLGLDVRWRALAADEQASATARAFGDALRGGEPAFPEGAWEQWLERWASAAPALAADADCVVAHDPEALAAVAGRPQDGARWIWRAHVDLSRPAAEAWRLAAPLAAAYDARVAPHAALAVPAEGVLAIAPAIDPLAPRNVELPPKVSGAVARSAGLDLARPLVCQAVDLDAWSDPEAAVDAWSAAREHVPGLQLVLLARMPGGDERAWRTYGELADYAAGLEDLLVLANVTGRGDAEINAVQRLARAALHGSLGHGWGIGVAEALWKGTPAVAAPGAGARELIGDGDEAAGYLAGSARERGARLVDLIEDPGLAAELGRVGRVRVRERFLVTRLLADELSLLERAAATAPAAG